MKSQINKKSVQFVSLILVLLFSNSIVFAYPPDNAAVLYYRSAYTYTMDSEKSDLTNKYIKGEIEINDEIKEYVEGKEHAVKQFIDASKGKYCDWGLDYSQGMAMLVPPLAEFRHLARITLAKAKMASEAGNYIEAINLCLSALQFEMHIGSADMPICTLVGYSTTALANDVLIQILPNISNDSVSLTWLRDEYSEILSKFPKMKTSIIKERNVFSQDIKLRDIDYFLNEFSMVLSQEQIDIIKEGGEAFVNEIMDYYTEHSSKYIAPFDSTYPESYETLVKLEEQPQNEGENNIYTKIVSYFVPGGSRLISAETKSKTYNNAIMTALNLYISNAQKGKLPDELQGGMPKDLFSGKDFKYEKTSNGFILKCQGKDLSKDETYEYKFNVKK
ncbi:MAG: hypothetical protein JW787_16475 [Sedimentisphaerales bacterium]|nr:hypothetical protein [Sedimentisphaerales bacterium]